MDRKILTYDSGEISFGGKAVVHDVSFSLEHGEILGLVGESGSGKSTKAKLLTRLTDITEGTLKFEGKDITRLKQIQLKEVYGDI
ncbi:ATP-binding cassette domain-containing protein [Anaerosalibacter bizertensis]|nr:ATP-binding cassette domain-containing protein [Anaerosalibacter bizertensis]